MANNNHFELTLDTLAPTGAIHWETAFAQSSAKVSITSDGSACLMKVWYDAVATGDTNSANYKAAVFEAYSTSKTFTNMPEGNWYAHMILSDDVNNKSNVINSTDDYAMVKCDQTKPTLSNVYLEDKDGSDPYAPYDAKAYTNKNTVNYHFEFADGGSYPSGVVEATVSGPFVGSPKTISGPTGGFVTDELTFDSTITAGKTATITVTVKDASGNVSDAGSASIEYDPEIESAKATIALVKTDGTTPLPAHISTTNTAATNYNPKIKVNVSSQGKDIRGYRVWEGANEPTDWVGPTTGTYINFPLSVEMTVSAGEGEKVFHCALKDKAGNYIESTTQSVNVDNTKPTISLTASGFNGSADKKIISNVSGYNTFTLTPTFSDTNSDINSWDLKNGTVSLKGSHKSGDVIEFTSTSASMTEGTNTFTLIATDNAGNTNSTTVQVIFDKTGPAISLSKPTNTWYTTSAAIDAQTSAVTDSNIINTVYAWISTSNTKSEAKPTAAKAVAFTGVSQTISNSDIEKSALIESAELYMHACAIDEVGNIGYATPVPFKFDSVKPVIESFGFEKQVYNTTTAKVLLSATDNVSGLKYMRIEGSGIANPTSATSGAVTVDETKWESYATEKSVTLKTPDGLKDAYVYVMDNAGNISEVKNAVATELDTSVPAATFKLFELGGTANKAAISSVDTFSVKIGCTDDSYLQGDHKMQYKLYGDFNTAHGKTGAITESAASWVDFTDADLSSADDAILVNNLYCTTGDGEKKIYLKVRDNAENTTQQLEVSFIYDTTPPTVDVENVDHNRISKVHEARHAGHVAEEGHESACFADECKFDIVPSEVIKAYKVCAYATQALATAGSHNDKAIPTAGGSTNVAGTGLNSSATIHCMVRGADYEAALNGGTTYTGTDHAFDGTHYIVVYVQDLAGTWSVAANFAA